MGQHFGGKDPPVQRQGRDRCGQDDGLPRFPDGDRDRHPLHQPFGHDAHGQQHDRSQGTNVSGNDPDLARGQAAHQDHHPDGGDPHHGHRSPNRPGPSSLGAETCAPYGLVIFQKRLEPRLPVLSGVAFQELMAPEDENDQNKQSGPEESLRYGQQSNRPVQIGIHGHRVQGEADTLGGCGFGEDPSEGEPGVNQPGQYHQQPTGNSGEQRFVGPGLEPTAGAFHASCTEIFEPEQQGQGQRNHHEELGADQSRQTRAHPPPEIPVPHGSAGLRRYERDQQDDQKGGGQWGLHA